MLDDASKVVVADGVEDVKGEGGAVEGDDAVGDAAGNAPEVAGFKDSGDAADGEFEAAGDEVAHLLVRVGVFGDNAAGLEFDDREHDPPAGGDAKIDAGEQGVVLAGAGGNEVGVGGRFGGGVGHRINVLGGIGP